MRHLFSEKYIKVFGVVPVDEMTQFVRYHIFDTASWSTNQLWIECDMTICCTVPPTLIHLLDILYLAALCSNFGAHFVQSAVDSVFVNVKYEQTFVLFHSVFPFLRGGNRPVKFIHCFLDPALDPAYCLIGGSIQDFFNHGQFFFGELP